MGSSDDRYSRIDYRRLIAWPQRIEREAPLLNKVLETAPARRILDLGCGTGEHARYLVSSGFEVVGVDASPSMIERAREEPVPPGLEFVEGDLRELDTLVAGVFGGALCLGNTLPHIRTREGLLKMLEGLRRRLAPGSPVVLQILNYQRIFQRRERHLPLSFRSDGDERIVFLRLMELQDDGEVLFFPSTLRLNPGAEQPLEVKASKQVRLRGWRPDELEEVLDQVDFGDRTLYGGFDEAAFRPADSRDLIIVARRS